jgi:LAO/AO transport system kinase
MTNIEQLIDGVLKGDRRFIAKTITLIENDLPESQKAVSLLYPHTGKAHIVGITGPPGSGKSTLIQKLVKELRRQGKTVGVVAVDPSSPFTGGAFLGDRVRMQELSTDEGVFIRSMATRGSVGALAKATKDAVKVLDASGKDVVVVETVGAGQSEVEIVKVAHTIAVVLAPGLGDDIQAIKAGIMEIGDIFVVNKADRENVNKAMIDIEAMLNMNPEREKWKPPVVKTTAITGEGITKLLDKIDQHRKYLEAGAIDTRLRQTVETELVEAIKEKVAEAIVDDLKKEGELDKLVQKILEKETDPYSVADMLLAKRVKRFKTSL